MTRFTIAIDVDDVLTPINEAMMHFINAKFNAGLKWDDYLVEGPYRQYWERIWKVSDEEAQHRYATFVKSGSLRTVSVMEGAIDAILQLKKKFNLIIVSARFGTQIEDTHHWLEQHFPRVFDNVHFVEMWDEAKRVTKAEVCKREGVNFLIDDNAEHCNLAAEEGITPLLFGEYGWNIGETLHPKGVRVKDWKEVLEYFDERS